MGPRDDGDGTVGTLSVAAFGYLQVSVMFGRGEHAVLQGVRVILVAQVSNQFFPVEFAVELVDLRNFLLELLQVAFRQTSHHEKLVELPILLQFTEFEDHVDAFFFGIADKAACVHDGNVTVHGLGVVVNLETLFLELVEQLFGIHQILGASHGDDVYLAHWSVVVWLWLG